MNFATIRLAGLGLVGALLLAAPQIAAAADLKIQGYITARDGAQMIVTAADGTNTTVTVTDSTDVKGIGGGLGMQRHDQDVTDLIPGLPVTVEAVQNGTELDAVAVRFKNSDLRAAQVARASQVENEKRIAANEAKNAELKKRLSEATEYVEKGEVTVLFALNSAVISAQGKQDLREFAKQAVEIKGYLVSVTGHADTTGDSAANQKLSERRAAAVVNYLQQHTPVKGYRVIASDPMGQSKQVGEAHTSEGKALNRRVVAKVLVNKGLEGL
jgi:OmpA-OmpF porin, OOP family